MTLGGLEKDLRRLNGVNKLLKVQVKKERELRERCDGK